MVAMATTQTVVSVIYLLGCYGSTWKMILNCSEPQDVATLLIPITKPCITCACFLWFEKWFLHTIYVYSHPCSVTIATHGISIVSAYQHIYPHFVSTCIWVNKKNINSTSATWHFVGRQTSSRPESIPSSATQLSVWAERETWPPHFCST